jgi:23S rRNA pseudouridine1911/1915/1917 synthase
MFPRIFEDEAVLVINKPAGVTVNRAETTRGQLTVEAWLPESALARRGIVHRLDKDTSGLLMIAKTAAALENLQKQFQQRLVKKTYLALVHGRVEPTSGTINLPVGRNPRQRRRFTVLIGGRPAVSGYRTIKNFAGYSLLAVYPVTGRTHQIRVHLQHLNHPLVADPLYLGSKRLNQDRRWCPRLFLHSQKIRFFHPLNRQLIKLSAPLPDELKTALDQLED